MALIICNTCGRFHKKGECKRAVNVESRYHGRPWITKKAKIRKRDNGVCVRCFKRGRGLRRGFDVHHIISANERPDLFLVSSNLMLVCEQCHAELHGKGKR